MKLEGIHHVTCLTGDAPRTADFIVRVLGLRVVKKSINQTDQTSYHVFFGDEKASAGLNISYFEYRGRPRGRAGAGNVHQITWRLQNEESIGFWQQRLENEGIDVVVNGSSLKFTDPDGLDHEFAVVETTDTPLTGESPDVPEQYRLVGHDGVRAFATDPDASLDCLVNKLNFVDIGNGRYEARGDIRGGWYALDPAPAEKRSFGGGCVQHVAWGCKPEDLEGWAKLSEEIASDATGMIDRHFFRSTYFTEPGGVLFEIAEHGGPGFIVDEPNHLHMGDDLQLPPWLEERRKLYEYTLTAIPTTAELRAGILAPRAGVTA